MSNSILFDDLNLTSTEKPQQQQAVVNGSNLANELSEVDHTGTHIIYGIAIK